jgi:hypothetical protein
MSNEYDIKLSNATKTPLKHDMRYIYNFIK